MQPVLKKLAVFHVFVSQVSLAMESIVKVIDYFISYISSNFKQSVMYYISILHVKSSLKKGMMLHVLSYFGLVIAL